MLLFLIIFRLARVFAENITKVDLTECKVSQFGSEYIGWKSYTESNETCQYWAVTKEKGSENLVDQAFPDGNKVLAKNFCRNPNWADLGPWCYTTDPRILREACDVPLCSIPECRLTGPGAEYAGNISKAISGRKCIKWKETYELIARHLEFELEGYQFPEGSVSEAENHCRNPNGNAAGPWCYVEEEESSLQEIEFCDVPFCDDLDPRIYSEGTAGRYVLFSSFNNSDSIRLSLRLWDENDWLRAKIYIVLSGFDIVSNSSELLDWSSAVEIMLSNTGSQIVNSEDAELTDTPHLLSAVKWTNLEITWTVVDNSMVVQVFKVGVVKPILAGEVDMEKKPLSKTSFRYFSLAGTPSLWNISLEREECHVHTTAVMEFTRYYLMEKTSLTIDVELFVRAATQAVILFRVAPMMESHQLKMVIDDGDKLKIAYYNEEKNFVVFSENSIPKVLDFWMWKSFKISIIKDRLQLFTEKSSGVEMLLDVTHPSLSRVMWISFGSPYVSYWAIYCDPRGTSDPPPAEPPECITNDADDFVGTQSVTSAGHQCIPWVDSNLPKPYQEESVFDFYGGKASCQNFCRNLGKDKSGPFCFIRDVTTGNLKKEYCHPRMCFSEDCVLAGTAKDYVGHLNETRSKRKCKRWVDVDEDYINVNNFPDPSMSDTGSFCRNPTGSIGGAWCFTIDPNVVRDYCYLRDCDKPLECTILSSLFQPGHLVYVMPSWRKTGLLFWLKTWNPDIYEGFKIRLISFDGELSYDLLIGDDENERVKFYFIDKEGEETLLEKKTLLHLVPAGKWGGFWLRPDMGKVELGYNGVDYPFFEWISMDPSLSFDPAFIDFGTIQGHWIGVNFLCSECLLERTTSSFPNRIYPINLWRADQIPLDTAPTGLVLNVRGIASFAILLMARPDFDQYVAVKLMSNGEEVSVWDYEWNFSNRKLAEYNSTRTFSPIEWTLYELSFSEHTIALKHGGSLVFIFNSVELFLFYWFSIKVYEGFVIWTANCPPGDIDGPPRNGEWGAWEPWECSASCGGGQGRTVRSCDNPPPNVFGRECPGSPIYEGPCNTFPCGEISPETHDQLRAHLTRNYSSLEVEAGQKVVLRCSRRMRKLLRHDVNRMNFTWTQNGFPYNRRRARMDQNYSLVIPKANEHDNGVYLCLGQKYSLTSPTKVVVDVKSLIVNHTNPTKKIRKGRGMTLKCNSVALSYVYGDLAQRWEINGKVWKDFGISTLDKVDVDKVESVDTEHDGIWTCVVEQTDLGFKWKTNWLNLKVNAAPNFWTHLTEDSATRPLFGRLKTEGQVKLVFAAIVITILILTIVPTVLLIKMFGKKNL